MTFKEASPWLFLSQYQRLPIFRIIRETGPNVGKRVEALNLNPDDSGYFVERELAREARLYAKYYIERYSPNWQDLKPEALNNKKLDQLGMGISQAVLETIFDDMEVPHVHNKPTIDRRSGEREREIVWHDFWIPGFGIIDVKSVFRYPYPNFSINCNDWCKENPDWLVGVYILDMPLQYNDCLLPDLPSAVWLVGYMSAVDVEDRDRIVGSPSPKRDFWLIPVKDPKWRKWKDLEDRLTEIANRLKEWQPA